MFKRRLSLLVTLALLACGGNGNEDNSRSDVSSSPLGQVLEPQSLLAISQDNKLGSSSYHRDSITLVAHTDAEGLNFSWQIKDSQGFVTAVQSNQKSLSFSPKKPGLYQVTVTISGNGEKQSTTTELQVINRAPEQPQLSIANGASATPKLGYTRILQARVSDPDEGDMPDTLHHNWQVMQGDHDVTDSVLNDRTATQPILTALAAADNNYHITLTVTDSYGAESPRSEPLTITVVNNRPPQRPATRIDMGHSSTHPGYRHRLIADVFDPDGDPLTYRWQVMQDHDNSVTDVTTSILADSSAAQPYFSTPRDAPIGTVYHITLTVTDDSNADSPRSKPLALPVINHAPGRPKLTLSGSSTGNILYRRDTREITAYAIDADNDPILLYHWQLMRNGQEITDPAMLTTADDSNSSTIIFTAPADSIVGDRYQITATASDGDRTSARSWPLLLTIDGPTAAFTASDAADNEGNYHRNKAILLDGSNSRANKDAANHHGLHFLWTLSDTTQSTVLLNSKNVTNSFTPNKSGIYTLQLTVTNNNGKQHSSSKTFTVINRAPDQAQIALKDGASDELYRRDSRELIASAIDPDGDTIFSYTWSVTKDGAIVDHLSLLSGIDDANDNSATFTAPNLSSALGTYQISVTIKDSDGGEIPAAKTLTVINRAPDQAQIALKDDASTTLHRRDSRELIASAIDPDGDTVFSYTWSVTKDDSTVDHLSLLSGIDDGDNSATFTAPNLSSALGTYQISVTIKDSDGGETPAAKTLTVINRAPDQAQIALKDGASDELYRRDSRELIASAIDPDGDTVFSYTWSVTKDDSTVDHLSLLSGIDDGDNSATFTAPNLSSALGTYQISVTIKDSDGGETQAAKTLTVINRAPNQAQIALKDGASDELYRRDSRELIASAIDPDGDTIFSYTWSVTKDGAIVDHRNLLSDIDDANDNSATFTAPNLSSALGTYQISVTIKDSDGGEIPAAKTLTVINRAPDQAQIALKDGASTTLHRRDSRELIASAIDPDGDTVFSYTWSVTKDDSTVDHRNLLSGIDDANDNSATFTAPNLSSALGTYQISVTIKDSDGGEIPAAKTLTVINRAPDQAQIALKDGASDELYRRDSRELIASAIDPDGDTIFSYTWSVTKDGAIVDHRNLLSDIDDANDNSTTFTAPNLSSALGTYQISVTIKDSDGGETPAAKTLTVINRAPDQAQIALKDDASTTLHRHDSRELIASAIDPDGDTVFSYTWSVTKDDSTVDHLSLLSGIDDGDNSATFTAPNLSSALGTYQISVTIKDSDGGETQAAKTLTVINRAPNQAQIALKDGASDELYRRDSRELIASAIDPDGDTIFSYTWSVTKDGAIVDHLSLFSGIDDGDNSATFTAPNLSSALGTYQISVTIKDSDGGETQAAKTLTVINRAPNQAQIALKDGASDELYRRDSRELIASAIDPDGDALSYRWQVMQGDRDVSDSVLNNRRAAQPILTADIAAAVGSSYRITVIVNDGYDDSSRSDPLALTVIELTAIITETTPETQWSAENSNGVGELTYQWTLDKKPNEATDLSGETNETLNYTPNKDGQYRLKLTVTDAENNSDSTYHAFGIGKDSNKAPIVSGIISVDPSGLKASPQQYLMLQAIDPDGDMLFTEWSGDSSCGTFADDGIYQGSLFALLDVSASATGECIVTAIVSDGYGDSIETTQSFTIQPAVDEDEIAFAYDTAARSFTLPEQSASYSLPARYFEEDIKTASSLQIPAGWTCDPACDSQQINFADTEKTITISKNNDDNSITLKLLASDNEAIAVLNRDDLDRVRHGLDATYFQLATIDLKGVLHRPDNSENHWTPIGLNYNNRFTGSYDSQSLPIRNLRIHSGQEHIGLFGYSQGTIQNIALQGLDVRGRNYVGGLAGDNSGNITGSYASGTVYGNRVVGGLVGSNLGANITGSYASGTVYGSNDFVGGLVGWSYNGSVNRSYATSSVSGDDKVGGLIGKNGGRSSINNSFASGNVSGSRNVGGLVGQIDGDNDISNSYATGFVSGNNYVGGLLGDNDENVSASASYWDKNTTWQPSSAGGEGKSTDEMRTQTSYVDWDFDSIWAIDENSDTDPKQRINYGYPYLLCVGGQAGYSFQASDCTAAE